MPSDPAGGGWWLPFEMGYGLGGIYIAAAPATVIYGIMMGGSIKAGMAGLRQPMTVKSWMSHIR